MAMAALAAMARGAQRVAVVCNTVRRAREVLARIKVATTHESFLVIGRSRPLDRQAIMARLEPRVASGALVTEPLVVVATQCIEAGADFDFDAMVTEACPLDALRQRLGRLDRLGLAGLSRCVVVASSRIEPIPPYGAAVAAAWAYLERVAGKTQEIDLGISAWTELAASAPPPPEANSPRPPSVSLLEPHLRLLARTWPRPGVEPEIDLLLHGLGHRGGDVSLVWRADIDTATLDVSAEILELLPPLALEALQIPVWEVRRWLGGDAAATLADTGDVEGALAPDEPRGEPPLGRLALRWLGMDEGAELVRASEIRPGDVLVVPADYGGCDAWGWAPASAEPVSDLGDAAWSQKRGYPVRRVVLAPGQEPNELRAQEAGSGRRLWAWTNGLVVEELPPKIPIESRYPEVLLNAHTEHVAAKAASFAMLLGLNARDLELAAHWHDAGKAYLPWQIMIKGGDLRRLAEPMLAKGKALDPRTRRKVCELARLPAGWRHEAESLRLLEASGALETADDADLVRWLVATHHGYARPWWPVVEGMPVDPGLADLMTRLGRRLGWWRLAWLEAVFRHADRSASREEQVADA
jgi:CRISPR-associated endonuclease/helicase Cas3